MPFTQRLYITFISLLLVACSEENSGENLLSVPVISKETVSGETLQDYQQLLQNHSHQQTISPSSLQVFSERYAKAGNSIYSINKKLKGDATHYSVTLIFDHVPKEDPVSSYRYDMQLKLENSILMISKMEQSWRCWQGRNHQSFSAEPCI